MTKKRKKRLRGQKAVDAVLNTIRRMRDPNRLISIRLPWKKKTR